MPAFHMQVMVRTSCVFVLCDKVECETGYLFGAALAHPGSVPIH